MTKKRVLKHGHCIKGHKLTKVPFSQNGAYCKKCDPTAEEYYEKMKAWRLSRMRLGKKNAKTVNLLNKIWYEELG
jgi:hypothetical protein